MKRLLQLLFILFLCQVSGFADLKKLVSLAPSVTESLYELGLESSVAGITIYCPKGTTQKEVIGTVWEPNLEKIVAMAPDLVFSSKEGNRKEVVERLMTLGVKVHVVEMDSDFDGICRNFEDIGRAVDREEKAREIIRSARTRLEKVRAKSAAFAPLGVFWEVGARPLFTISSKSFINDFNHYTNTVNIFADLAARYPQISREEVVRRNPDAILLVTMGDVTGSELDYWKKFKDMKAVKNRNLRILTASEIFTPTPLTFATGVELLDRLLHDRGDK